MTAFFPSWTRSWKSWPALLLFCGLAVLWGRWPIVALDFDLWYHLTGGAWIAQHMRLPDTPFFSYAPVGNEWVDYYWLFQVLVHALYQAGGYVALSLLRTVVYLGTVWGVYVYLCTAYKDEGDAPVLWPLLLTCAYALSLQSRDIIVRPHTITYFYIIFLHYVLNYRQRWAWFLPFLTVVWANLHGVEYPVVLLVLGAYLGEYFLAKMSRRDDAAARLAAVRWPAILSLYAVLVTPAGLSLLAKAFNGPPFHDRIVIELMAQPLGSFLSLSFFPDGRLVVGAAHFLVLGAVLGAVWLAVNRRLRPSRVVLLAGALVLLPMMRRFTFEFILLTLPVLGDAAVLFGKRFGRPLRARTTACVLFATVAVTLWTTVTSFGNRPAYPVDTARLPVGVCDFLMNEGPGGRVFNVPNPGGYLQWRLFPKYTIYMDMQTMLFPGIDLFTAINAFGSLPVMRGVVRDYHPGFLLAYIQDKEFQKRVADVGGHFVPVFFDDVLTLYADADKYPDLVARYKLTELDPASCVTDDYDSMTAEKRDKVLAECQRLLAVYPDGLVANTVLAKILLAKGQAREAEAIAAGLMKRFPDRYMGYALAGLAAFKEERFADALAFNETALRLAMPAERELVLRNIYATYARLKEFGKAYATLLTAVNPMASTTTFTDLYDLAMAGIASGKVREGEQLLAMAKAKAGEGDAAKLKELDRLAGMLKEGRP